LLYMTNLRGADLRKANLQNIIFPSLSLLDATDLRGADLRGASFCTNRECQRSYTTGSNPLASLARGLRRKPKLKDAIFDRCTRFENVSSERLRDYGKRLGMIYQEKTQGEDCDIDDSNRQQVYTALFHREREMRSQL